MTDPNSTLTILQYFDSFLTLIAMSLAIWAFATGKIMPRRIFDELVEKYNDRLARQIAEGMEKSVKDGIKGAFAEMGIKGRRQSDPPPVWEKISDGD